MEGTNQEVVKHGMRILFMYNDNNDNNKCIYNNNNNNKNYNNSNNNNVYNNNDNNNK